MSSATTQRVATGAWPWVLALAVTAPLLAPGFVLSYDMVFVPRQDLLPESLGLGGPLPRSVPVDAVVALATQVIPGDLLQKAVLVAVLGMAGWGASRLVPTTVTAGRLAAASWYVWNPYVAERLVIGHWALLVGYASLPWLVEAAMRLRDREPDAQRRLLALLVPAALTPSAGLISLLMVIPVLGWPGARGQRRALTVTLGGWAVLNAPWWLPGMLHPSATVSGAQGADAFAARAEGIVGTVGSLLSLGGIWNADAVPTSRELAVSAVWLVLFLGVAALGIRPLLAATGPAGAGLLVSAGIGFAIAVAGAVPVFSEATAWAIRSVPGGGLLRDGHKFLAPFAVASSLAFGLGVVEATRRLAPAAGRAVHVALVLVPLMAMPDFAWGVSGRLEPVAYPKDWAVVRQLLQEEGGTGHVVSLPWQAFRQFGWNDNRVLLDPAPRWLPTTTVVDDTLVVGSLTVSGEDPRAAAVSAALDSGRPASESLPPLGIGWLVVEHGTPGDVDPSLIAGAAMVHDGADLSLLKLPGARSTALPGWAPLVIVVDVVALLLALGVILLPLPVKRLRALRHAARVRGS